MVQGYLYIASAFQSLKQSGCTVGGELDNDPHIWRKPYTWGICRPDIRNAVSEGDYIFFVLGKKANLPQMIFAYIKVGEVLTHQQAFHRRELKSKRMIGNKKTEGNIIVNSDGSYNGNDYKIHFKNFDEIKKKYVIADMIHSKVITTQEIVSKAQDFVSFLNKLLDKDGDSPYKIISQKGIWGLKEEQVKQLIGWLK